MTYELYQVNDQLTRLEAILKLKNISYDNKVSDITFGRDEDTGMLEYRWNEGAYTRTVGINYNNETEDFTVFCDGIFKNQTLDDIVYRVIEKFEKSLSSYDPTKVVESKSNVAEAKDQRGIVVDPELEDFDKKMAMFK